MTKESLYDKGETFASLVYDSRPKSSGLNNLKPKGYTLTGHRLSYRMSAFFKKRREFPNVNAKLRKDLNLCSVWTGKLKVLS